VQAGENEVEENSIGPNLGGGGQGGRPILGRAHVVAVQHQQPAQPLRRVRVVVYEEDPKRARKGRFGHDPSPGSRASKMGGRRGWPSWLRPRGTVRPAGERACPTDGGA